MKIKLRAWHKELKCMLYPPLPIDSMVYCRNSNNEHPYIKIDGEIHPMTAHLTWDGRWYINGRFQDVIWMPFTGLCDRTGKEIYEDDILQECRPGERIWERYPDEAGVVKITPTGIVRYQAPSFNVEKLRIGLVEKDNGNKSALYMNHYDGMYQFIDEDMEVIGNVHENRELLSEKS